jgi:SAM-dependent methyltransferase
MKGDSKKFNIDTAVVSAFGKEWQRFDQSALDDGDRQQMFHQYFEIFPWDKLPAGAIGADIGCGSGRWALLTAPRVGLLHCIDPSEQALAVAKKNLFGLDNVRFHQASVDTLPFPDSLLDFAYSLGVLHHVPDTAAAIRSVAAKLKSGAVFLVYLYYAFDNRPAWYRLIWRASNWLRMAVARLPFLLRYAFSQAMAFGVYWPLARFARVLERFGWLPSNWPLAYYRNKGFYVMRTDALDRFGTRLEHRYTRLQITAMLQAAGFAEIRFSDSPPYWCAVAIRR